MKELVAIQSKLKAPKGQYNTFGKYKYRRAEDILEAVKPILTEQKCSLIISDDVIQVGARIYIKATATLTNEKGEQVFATAYAREEENKKGMDASQVTGATSSYARKYALNGLFCIDDTDDADTLNTGSVSVEFAIEEVNKCNSRAEVTSVWNKYAAFQNDGEFVKACKSRVKEVENG